MGRKFKIGDPVKILWEKSGYDKHPDYRDFGVVKYIGCQNAIYVTKYDTKDPGLELIFSEEDLEILNQIA